MKVFAVIPVLLVVLVSLCGSPVPPPATRTVSPTPPATPRNRAQAQPTRFVANNIDDAILLAKSTFNRNGSTLAIAHVDSAIYVETTVAQARAFFAPSYPGDWGVPDSDRVWVIVAYGQFEPTAMGITDPSPAVVSTAWDVVVEGTDLRRGW